MSSSDDELEDLTEPDELPEEIVHWQPTHSHISSSARRAVASGAGALGAGSVLLMATGALAIGALAIGAIAIGRMSVGRAHFKELEIDHLIVRRMSVMGVGPRRRR